MSHIRSHRLPRPARLLQLGALPSQRDDECRLAAGRDAGPLALPSPRRLRPLADVVGSAFPEGRIFRHGPARRARLEPSHELSPRQHAAHESFGHKLVLPQKRQPLTGLFRGAVHLGAFAGHGARSVGAICEPIAFNGVVEVPPGVLGPRDGDVVVDLVEPGCEPLEWFSPIVQQQVFCDIVPSSWHNPNLSQWLILCRPVSSRPASPTASERCKSGPDWVHEVKHDGYRLIARRTDDRVRLYTRRGFNWAAILASSRRCDRFPIVSGGLLANETAPAKPRQSSKWPCASMTRLLQR